MSSQTSLKYLDNPQKYCSLITNLIENADDSWQAFWKSAIVEILTSSEYSINTVNALLKVIEKAFKERTYHVRAQAFDCWQFFISKVEEKSTSEKLLLVILIPLCASNHSVKIVLDSKLKAWLTLLNTENLCKSITKEKIVYLLKILYGPHSLPTASSFPDLSELCGSIYKIVLRKCLKNDDNTILSYLERAIPKLSANVNSQHVGKEIWRISLEHISEKWSMIKFTYLMKTLENVLSTNQEKGNKFMCELLPVLICEYDSYPVDYVMPKLSLMTRCLFHLSPNELNLATTLEYLIKKFKKKEPLLFDEMNKALTEFSEDYRDELHKCWAAIVSCFRKLIKNETDSDIYDWILLFPVKYLHEKWNSMIQEKMEACFEDMYVCFKVDVFIKNISRKLNTLLSNSENVPMSMLSAATCLCRIVLQKAPSDEVCSLKDTLIIINDMIPLRMSLDEVQTQFITKYLVCVLYFMKDYPDYDHDLTTIIQKYSEHIDIDRDSKDFPVVQILSKYTNKSKQDEKLNNIEKATPILEESVTPNKPVRGFLSRLSPAGNKVADGSPLMNRSVGAPKSQAMNTPKSQKSLNEDDSVQFVAIKSTPKNSPMTNHQKEKAKEKTYIPALYEDLSQSQSHSDSQSMLPPKTISHITIALPEIIEENAVLPSTNDTNTDSADEVPSSFNFRDAIMKEKSSNAFASKKSLFNDTNMSMNSTPTKSKSADDKVSEKDPTSTKMSASKRKSLRTENKVVEEEAPKRAKGSAEVVRTELDFSTPQAPAKTSTRGRKKSMPASEEKSCDTSAKQTENTIDTESQNLFMSKTLKTVVSSPVHSLMTMKNGFDVKITRRSLRSKNPNATPVRSPIGTRKRKSLTAESTSAKKSTSLTMDESCSQINESVVKAETTEKSKPVTQTSTNEEGSTKTEEENASVWTDSVMIVEDDTTIDVITIDSQTTSPVIEQVPERACVIVNTKDAAEESTFLESTQEATKQDIEERILPANDENAKSSQNSFNLALSENENVKVIKDGQAEEEITSPEKESTLESGAEAQQNIEPPPAATRVEAGGESADAQKEDDVEPDKTENLRLNASASPLAGNSRTSQMLKMIYGTQTLVKSKVRAKQSPRNPAFITSSSVGSPVNGVGNRMTANSRTMKMLQVNGHVESPVKPSPSKVSLNFCEKLEKFVYVPKECTSPGILKRPSLNATMSPKSPKSVNFAERLTDTREYQVDESNYTDSWSSNDTQPSDNLVSEDEATSQDTLYPALRNCNDEIKNIAERLTLNRQQLDTMRRMGIETVGQLASISTSVGRSIPVGDNRVQRLRNALKAYDNDRKLKGLRAPSVRRKIMYKSLVEVSSIIEILDDELEDCEAEGTNMQEKETEKAVKSFPQPTVTLVKLKDEEVNASTTFSSEKAPLVKEATPSSPVKTTEEAIGSPVRVTRSQASPTKNEIVAPESPKSNEVVPSLALRLTRSLLNSPVKTGETAPSSPVRTNTTASPLRVVDKTPSSPSKANNSPRCSPCKVALIAPLPIETIVTTTDCDKEKRSPCEPISSPVKRSSKIMEIIKERAEIIEEGAGIVEENEIEQDSKKKEAPVEVVNIEYEPTQDDDLDFICTNNEEGTFKGEIRRTYSKLIKGGRTLMTMRAHENIASKPWSPEIITVEINDSTSTCTEEKEEMQESANKTMDSQSEQQSVSIFSPDVSKSVEEVEISIIRSEQEYETNNGSVSLISDSFISDCVKSTVEVATRDDEAVTSSKIELHLDDAQVIKETDDVYRTVLQCVVKHCMKPSCVWPSDESEARNEILKIFESLGDGMERIRNAGLMDSEMKEMLSDIISKYVKYGD